MSSVYQYICQKIHVGQVIDTPSGRSSFRIAKISADGIVLLSEPSQRKVCVTPCMFDETVGRLVLDHIRNGYGILIGQTAHSHPGSLYDSFDNNGWEPQHASRVAAILEEVKIAEYPPGCPPWRIRLSCPRKTSGNTSPGSGRQTPR